MFSGIVEAQSKIAKFSDLKNAVRIEVLKPKIFNDLKIGDSISANGVCLTVEALKPKAIQFCIGAETLKVLGHRFATWKKYPLNLERSLKFGARVHGHLVTGHVDACGKITKSFQDGESWQMQVEIPKQLAPYFWKKGAVSLNGVSLTVNKFFKSKSKYFLEVCLIPETLKITNLKSYQVDDYVSLEADYLAKAYFQSRHTSVKEPS